MMHPFGILLIWLACGVVVVVGLYCFNYRNFCQVIHDRAQYTIPTMIIIIASVIVSWPFMLLYSGKEW